MEDIPVLDEVFFALYTLAARLFGALLALMLDIVGVRYGFARMKPRSKSVWITPAALGPLRPYAPSRRGLLWVHR